METVKEGKLIVVSGSSGSGKGTVLNELFTLGENFTYSVSRTTRTPRVGEKEGRDYFFVDRDSFIRDIDANRFLEYAEYCNNLYGTPRDFVESKLKSGINVILELEVKGAFQIKYQYPESVLVFISPPSFKELKTRLKDRKTESYEVVKARLDIARRETELASEYDYILINYDGKAIETARQIVDIANGRHKSNIDKHEFIQSFLQDK